MPSARFSGRILVNGAEIDISTVWWLSEEKGDLGRTLHVIVVKSLASGDFITAEARSAGVSGLTSMDASAAALTAIKMSEAPPA